MKKRYLLLQKNFGTLEVYPEKDKTKNLTNFQCVQCFSHGVKIKPERSKGCFYKKIMKDGILIVPIDTYHLIYLLYGLEFPQMLEEEKQNSPICYLHMII